MRNLLRHFVDERIALRQLLYNTLTTEARYYFRILSFKARIAHMLKAIDGSTI